MSPEGCSVLTPSLCKVSLRSQRDTVHTLIFSFLLEVRGYILGETLRLYRQLHRWNFKLESTPGTISEATYISLYLCSGWPRA